MAHVIVIETLVDQTFVRERCGCDEFEDRAGIVADARHSLEATER